MTCHEFADSVTGFLDGTLGLSQTAQARVHLLICSSCRAYLEQMRQVVATLQRIDAPAPAPAPAPDATKAALRARLAGKAK